MTCVGKQNQLLRKGKLGRHGGQRQPRTSLLREEPEGSSVGGDWPEPSLELSWAS